MFASVKVKLFKLEREFNSLSVFDFHITLYENEIVACYAVRSVILQFPKHKIHNYLSVATFDGRRNVHVLAHCVMI